ncbi:bifunctional 4-hydroxy-2-oxoglutarate aldolase/2-dehydro-3-deoxy-phosphogluconate aldolase [Microbacterium maritypicum]|uniref:bifunctional 4-hydroxy-2-oxoglutarate aldolase/2-dehydro-3-deoxy-phosphogluconate aldolase n=1 Tax=Microbacterium maritypicum TaxID=33918 RepID=UPI0026727274|nr:bifunctional 4-hydroxy-2-oxoglutarate aldolase/2-dehydro-3-deoxy-phosphogluconate aldolase [Microbacterium liquefaciens]WKT88110.1 bifunctional 4-hydroxy-2-oxoglutarate aldolase/2-dehydro-3-deoxy-phosphogluconate aldolase [Microbacterium liquefaciens]
MSAVDNAELQERLRTTRLVAILRGTDVDATVAAARTLLQVGVLTLEIALTLQDAEEAIAQIVQDAPATALVGAGTVLDEADVERAVSAGAQFMVTPTLSASVPYAVSQGIGVLAGVYTPTEIQRGHDLGSAAVKLFPASALGSGFLRAVRDPFPQARIIPVGGVRVDTVAEYLAAGAFGIGVGGPLVGDATAPGGDLEALAVRASAFVQACAMDDPRLP